MYTVGRGLSTGSRRNHEWPSFSRRRSRAGKRPLTLAQSSSRASAVLARSRAAIGPDRGGLQLRSVRMQGTLMRSQLVIQDQRAGVVRSQTREWPLVLECVPPDRYVRTWDMGPNLRREGVDGAGPPAVRQRVPRRRSLHHRRHRRRGRARFRAADKIPAAGGVRAPDALAGRVPGAAGGEGGGLTAAFCCVAAKDAVR